MDSLSLLSLFCGGRHRRSEQWVAYCSTMLLVMFWVFSPLWVNQLNSRGYRANCSALTTPCPMETQETWPEPWGYSIWVSLTWNFQWRLLKRAGADSFAEAVLLPFKSQVCWSEISWFAEVKFVHETWIQDPILATLLHHETHLITKHFLSYGNTSFMFIFKGFHV